MRAVLAAAALLLALAPSARADHPHWYQGETGQGEPVRIDAGPDRVPQQATVSWRARGCPGGRLELETELFSPFRHAGSRRLSERRTIYRSYLEGRDYAMRLRFEGTRRDRHWRGTFTVRVRVLREGRLLGRCTTGRVRWSAGVHVARLAISSEPGDWVGAGREWFFSDRRAAVEAWVHEDHAVVVEWMRHDGTHWSIHLNAEPGEPLREGRTYRGDEVINTGGDGRGCGGQTGTVSVRDIALDRRGRVRRLRAAFTQNCHSDEAGLRGTLRFRRAY